MGLSVWMCVLCSLLQAGALAQPLRCPPGSDRGCARGLITNDADEQYADSMEHQRPTLSGARRHSLGVTKRQRDPEHRRAAHHLLNQSSQSTQYSQPGAVTARGFPNTLIQAERARRHLATPTSAKKGKRKPRVGSFSLIINNNPSAPLQISRARRQVKTDPPKRGKSGRSGAYSVLGDPQAEGQTERARRSV